MAAGGLDEDRGAGTLVSENSIGILIERSTWVSAARLMTTS
jgi:hypothetical protein